MTVLDDIIGNCAALEQENKRLRAALELWVQYDDLDERDFAGVGPMFRYDECIAATRKALKQ